MSGFWLSEEQEAIVESVTRLCAGFDADYWRQTDESGDFPEEFVAAMAAGGWLGTAMPAELGGAGLGDRTVEPAKVEPLKAAGARLFPHLAGASFEAETGVRGATPDGLPMIGRGRHQDVLLAVGARRNGWLLAPLVARLIVACVTEGEAGPFADAMSPARFDAPAK